MPFPAHVVILLLLLSLALFYRFEALLYPAVYFRHVSCQGRQFGLLAPGTFHHVPQDGNIFLLYTSTPERRGTAPTKRPAAGNPGTAGTAGGTPPDGSPERQTETSRRYAENGQLVRHVGKSGGGDVYKRQVSTKGRVSLEEQADGSLRVVPHYWQERPDLCLLYTSRCV